jgi:ABC-type nitrate/sulfonate/bicarbonate transport system substrate-binding protein
MIMPVTKTLAETIRIGFPRQMGSSLVWVADSQGFFKKQGVDIVMKEYEAGVMAVNDLIADKIDVAISAEFVFVLRSFNHADLRMPATICAASDHEFIVRKDLNIAGPQDLQGKRVAVTRGSSGEFFLYNYLIFNSIPLDRIRIVYLTPLEIVKAVADGTVDAALSWQPYISQMAKQMGTKIARWPAQSGQDYYMILMAKESFLKRQPKTVEHFITALSEAEQFIAKYPNRAKTILQQRLGLPAEFFLDVWSHTRIELQLTQDLLVLMEREAKWAIRSKIVDKKEMPNYLDFFYFEALKKVKPEAVSLVH